MKPDALWNGVSDDPVDGELELLRSAVGMVDDSQLGEVYDDEGTS